MSIPAIYITLRDNDSDTLPVRFNIESAYYNTEEIKNIDLQYPGKRYIYVDIDMDGIRKILEEMIHQCLPDPDQYMYIPQTLRKYHDMQWRRYFHDLMGKASVIQS